MQNWTFALQHLAPSLIACASFCALDYCREQTLHYIIPGVRRLPHPKTPCRLPASFPSVPGKILPSRNLASFSSLVSLRIPTFKTKPARISKATRSAQVMVLVFSILSCLCEAVGSLQGHHYFLGVTAEILNVGLNWSKMKWWFDHTENSCTCRPTFSIVVMIMISNINSIA